MNAASLMRQLIDRYKAIVRVYRDDDDHLKIEPWIPNPHSGKPEPMLYISKGIVPRNGYKGGRVGLLLSEDEAVWLIEQLQQILNDPKMQKDTTT